MKKNEKERKRRSNVPGCGGVVGLRANSLNKTRFGGCCRLRGRKEKRWLCLPTRTLPLSESLSPTGWLVGLCLSPRVLSLAQATAEKNHNYPLPVARFIPLLPCYSSVSVDTVILGSLAVRTFRTVGLQRALRLSVECVAGNPRPKCPRPEVG